MNSFNVPFVSTMGDCIDLEIEYKIQHYNLYITTLVIIDYM